MLGLTSRILSLISCIVSFQEKGKGFLDNCYTDFLADHPFKPRNWTEHPIYYGP